MSTDVINATARAKGSRIDHLPAEPFIMAPRLTVDIYIDYTDATVIDKGRGQGFGMEPEDFPRVTEYIHLRCNDENKCYPCRVVSCNSGKDCTTVIYGKREQYAIEYVSMRHRDWHYFVDAYKGKLEENEYDPAAYDIALGQSADPSTHTAYVCVYLAPSNDIRLHQKRPCRRKTTIWIYKVMFYGT